MEVKETVDLGEGHRIEFGDASWNPKKRSIRNRYPTAKGGFSPRSSSEIPLKDLDRMLIETAKRDLIPTQAAAALIEALAASITRQQC